MAKTRKKIYFNEEEILLASKIYKETKYLSNFISFLQEQNTNTFSCIIINNKNKGFKNLLIEQKRDSDILKVISPEHGLFYIIAQETDENGSIKFIKRLMKAGKENLNNEFDSFGVVVSVKNKNIDSQCILFKLIQEYLFYIKQEEMYRIDGVVSTTL